MKQGFKRPVVWALMMTLVCWPACSRAGAGTVPLQAGSAVAFRVDAKHPETFSLRIAPGSAVEVRIRQQRGPMLLKIRPPQGRALTPRYCQSGVECVLPVTLVAPADGLYRLTLSFFVHCCMQQQQAAGTIRVSATRAATATDRLRAEAEQYLARAEWAQINGSSKTWPGALQDYRTAISIARRIGDIWLLRVALPDEARLDTYELDHYHAALRLARDAVRLPYGKDQADHEFALFAYGLVCQYRARYGAAIRAERQAKTIAAHLGELQGEDIIVGNLAGVYEEIGRTGLALRSAHQSLAIARQIGDGKGVDYNLELIAELYSDRGEFNRAFAYFQRALESVRHYPYPDSEARSWIGLGELYDTLNEPAQARAALLTARRIATAAHDSTALFRVLMDRAVVKRQEGDLRSALAYDQKGVARAAALGLPRQQSNLMLDLGRDYAALGEHRRAMSAYRGAIALARRIDQLEVEAAAWLALGDEETRSGHFSQAQTDYIQALDVGRRLYSPLIEASAEGSLARLDFKRGALERARRRIERALELIGAVRSTVITQHLRTEYFVSEHGYYDLGVVILMALRQHYPGKGYARAALRLVERARARSLLDALHSAGQTDAALLPTDLPNRMHHIEAELDIAYADWRDLLQDPSASASRFTALRKHIGALRRTAAILDALARARGGRYTALADAHPASLRQLQDRTLGPHAALLEYWIGAHSGYVWLVRRHSVVVFPVPGAAAITPEVRALRRALTARSRTVPGESLQVRIARIAAADARVDRLDRSLGAELLPTLPLLRGLNTLYVVVDGPLFGVPFAALRPSGRDRALVDSVAVLEEPSASVLSFLARLEPAHGSGRIALFADPVYNRNDPRLAVAARRRTGPSGSVRLTWAPQAYLAHLARLPASRAEALAIARLSDNRAELHLGFDASVTAVQQTDWHQVAVAHFAVHALLDADHPGLSGLVLSLYHRNGTPARGVLWLREIYALHMPVDLVVLSSCRTLGGRDVPGEGMVGLFRAFLLSGAHAVLGTLWRVQDRSAARFMRLFYVNLLQRRMSPAEALRAAQRTSMRSLRYASPYYWAAFSLEGVGAPLQSASPIRNARR